MTGGVRRVATSVSRLPRLTVTRVLLCVAVLAIVYLTFTTGRYAIRNYQLHREEAQLHADLRRLDAERQQLVSVRDYLESDSYVELIARRVLGLVRPGETLVIVHGPEAPVAEPEEQTEAGGRWWERLFLPAGE